MNYIILLNEGKSKAGQLKLPSVIRLGVAVKGEGEAERLMFTKAI